MEYPNNFRHPVEHLLPSLSFDSYISSRTIDQVIDNFAKLWLRAMNRYAKMVFNYSITYYEGATSLD